MQPETEVAASDVGQAGPMVKVKSGNISGLIALRQQMKILGAEMLGELSRLGSEKSLKAGQKLKTAEAIVHELTRVAEVVHVLTQTIGDTPQNVDAAGLA